METEKKFINKILLNGLIKCQEYLKDNRKITYLLKDIHITLNNIGEFGEVGTKFYNDFQTIVQYERKENIKGFQRNRTNKQIVNDSIDNLIIEIKKELKEE